MYITILSKSVAKIELMLYNHKYRKLVEAYTSLLRGSETLWGEVFFRFKYKFDFYLYKYIA